MPTTTLSCPACQFTKDVELQTIPKKAKRVTCPKCRNVFQFSPHNAPRETNPSAPTQLNVPSTNANLNSPLPGNELRKARNILFAVYFLLIFASLFAGRLYFSNKAIESPVPNFITTSERGIATQWMDQIMITDHSGKLLKQIDLPEDIIPTQVIWVEDDLWVADYRSGNILVVGDLDQGWLNLRGGQIKGHFKVVPDLDNNRIFVSAGHAIQIFDRNGEFQYSFGREGRKPGELKFPNQFLMDKDGNLMISNTKRPAIDKFSPDGTFLETIVTPVGNPIYKFPTDVIVFPDRIVTLEGDDYLRDSRIALYDRGGNYLGQFDGVKDFKEIGDIAAWGDRIFASDLNKAKVYALDATDLTFIGEYSDDLKRLGERFQKESLMWEWLAKICLAGLLLLLVPVAYFYVRFRMQAGKAQAQSRADASTRAEMVPVEKNNSSGKVDLSSFGAVKFIAVETRAVVDILSILCLGLVPLAAVYQALHMAEGPSPFFIVAIVALPVGLYLSLRSSWGCTTSLKKAKNLLRKLVQNKGLEVMSGVGQVGIAFCIDKKSLLFLMAQKSVLVAEFDWFGRLRAIFRVNYDSVHIEDKPFILPALKIVFGDKVKNVQAIDKKYLSRLKSALKNYMHASDSESSEAIQGEPVKPERKMHPKAALLSAIFPGLGQFYKRHIIRGALLMICFTPIALTIAINAEPTYVESIDWGPESIDHLIQVLAVGLPLYLIGLWDALRS